ncbi:MAG: hypothetical protein ACOZIN_12710 [Myxococcota bacterium]
MRSLLFFLPALSFALLGCKGPCRQLSEKLCECAINSVERDSCLRRVSSQAGAFETTSAQDVTCAELLPKCDCHLVDTEEGKVNCGLARPRPDTGS